MNLTFDDYRAKQHEPNIFVGKAREPKYNPFCKRSDQNNFRIFWSSTTIQLTTLVDSECSSCNNLARS